MVNAEIELMAMITLEKAKIRVVRKAKFCNGSHRRQRGKDQQDGD